MKPLDLCFLKHSTNIVLFFPLLVRIKSELHHFSMTALIVEIYDLI